MDHNIYFMVAKIGQSMAHYVLFINFWYCEAPVLDHLNLKPFIHTYSLQSYYNVNSWNCLFFLPKKFLLIKFINFAQFNGFAEKVKQET